MSDFDWWFTRLASNEDHAEDAAQTRYENDADSFRKGES